MYAYELNVGYSVTDAELMMTVPAMLDCFQDAAIFEAQHGKITMEYLSRRHIAWLLGSWQIVIGRRPKFNERIRVTTSPYEFKGFLGYRNFTIADQTGDLLVKAASIWTLIDKDKQRPARPGQELIDGYELQERLDMDYAPRKIALIGDGRAGGTFRVRGSQIDSNRHMNNVEYVRAAMEFLPENAAVRELRAEYKKAAYRGDELTAVLYGHGQGAQQKLQVQLNDAQGSTDAVVEFTWEQAYE